MKYRIQGVSFPDEALHRAAMARAKAERRSFSNYICWLVEADLRAAGLWPPTDRREANEGAALPKPSAAGKPAIKAGSKRV